jgi:hypothetical protein
MYIDLFPEATKKRQEEQKKWVNQFNVLTKPKQATNFNSTDPFNLFSKVNLKSEAEQKQTISSLDKAERLKTVAKDNSYADIQTQILDTIAEKTGSKYMSFEIARTGKGSFEIDGKFSETEKIMKDKKGADGVFIMPDGNEITFGFRRMSGTPEDKVNDEMCVHNFTKSCKLRSTGIHDERFPGSIRKPDIDITVFKNNNVVVISATKQELYVDKNIKEGVKSAHELLKDPELARSGSKIAEELKKINSTLPQGVKLNFCKTKEKLTPDEITVDVLFGGQFIHNNFVKMPVNMSKESYCPKEGLKDLFQTIQHSKTPTKNISI